MPLCVAQPVIDQVYCRLNTPNSCAPMHTGLCRVCSTGAVTPDEGPPTPCLATPLVCPLLPPPLHQLPCCLHSTSPASQASSSNTHKFKPTPCKPAQPRACRACLTCPEGSPHPTAKPSLMRHLLVPSTMFYPPTSKARRRSPFPPGLILKV